MKILVTFVCLLLAGAVQVKAQKPEHVIPCTLVNNALYVQGVINGKTCNLLYDTGAYGLILDVDFAKRAKVEQTEQIKHPEIDITFDNLKIKRPVYTIQDCTTVGGSDENGIIGVDFFEDYIVEIDYIKKTLSLYNPSDIDSIKGYTLLNAKHITNNTALYGRFTTNLIVTTPHGDSINGNFLLDTGSERNITILDHIPIKVDSNFIIVNGIYSSYIGIDRSKYFKAKAVQFVNDSYGGLIIDYSLGNNERLAPSIDGIIGGEFLRNFKLLIDYKNSRVYAKRIPAALWNFTTTFYSNGIGYKDRRGDLGGFLVSNFIGSPVTGIRLGDLITDIDHKKVTKLTSADIRKAYKGGDLITYKIKRGRKSFEITTIVKRML